MSYFEQVLLQQKLNTVLGFSTLESPNNVLHFDCNKTFPAHHISELRSDKICKNSPFCNFKCKFFKIVT